MSEVRTAPIERSWHVMVRLETAANDELNPGQYRQCAPGEFDGRRILAMWRCPRCAKFAGLGTNHDVELMGLVVPAISCPYECGFAASMYLESWHPAAKGTA